MQLFRYTAIDEGGRRIRGTVSASGESAAFEHLRARGFVPVTLSSSGAGAAKSQAGSSLKDRDVVDLVSNLGLLLGAGADMRSALSTLAARTTRKEVSAVCRGLMADIGGGASLDASFARHLARHADFVAAMVAAGEASGDLPGSLARAAEILESRMKLRAKLGSVLAYPLFVLVSTIAAVLALLLFVVPSLAPLLEGGDTPAPASLRLMIGASDALRGNALLVSVALSVAVVVAFLLYRIGLLQRAMDVALHEGPARRTMCALTFGSFAIVLGGMLTASSPMSEALRLAIRAMRSPVGQERLEPVLQAVRQGETLSIALENVKGVPPTLTRLAAVGEATGALGPMLARAGKLEEETAMADIERFGQLLGPALIVALGGLVGVLMAALLSGVSQLGQSALQ